jgi:sugar-specific transcriptional regulator TrmB
MQSPIKDLLELGLSESEATIYLSMIAGVTTARDLVKTTGFKRPTVYYCLGTLEKRGLISKNGLAGDKRFSVEPLERLSIIAGEKAAAAARLKEKIVATIPLLTAQRGPTNTKPAVAFFEGTEAVKTVVMDMLYCKDGQIKSVVPSDNFFWQVGEEFVEHFVSERRKRRIKTRNLWCAPIEKGLVKEYYEGLSEIRILPSIMRDKFMTTVFLYDDKTLYVSSKKNSYCILITSKEHNETMQAWFEGLWLSSKPHRK